MKTRFITAADRMLQLATARPQERLKEYVGAGSQGAGLVKSARIVKISPKC